MTEGTNKRFNYDSYEQDPSKVDCCKWMHVSKTSNFATCLVQNTTRTAAATSVIATHATGSSSPATSNNLYSVLSSDNKSSINENDRLTHDNPTSTSTARTLAGAVHEKEPTVKNGTTKGEFGTQVGGVPLHAPVGRHVVLALPESVKKVLHE